MSIFDDHLGVHSEIVYWAKEFAGIASGIPGVQLWVAMKTSSRSS